MTTKMKGTLRIALTLTMVTTVIALLLWLLQSLSGREERSSNRLLYSAVTDIRSIVRVTSMEGVRSVPVEYSEDGIGAFGVGTYRFRISYDVEKLESYIQGDTLVVRLPREQVTILEDETAGFKVLDIWGTNVLKRLSGPKLTIQAENKMRSKAMAQVRSDLNNEGVPAKARSHAISLIGEMLSLVPGTVIVIDADAPLPPSLLPESAVCPNPELSHSELPRPIMPPSRMR